MISRVAALDLFSKVSIFSLTITRKRCAYQVCLSPFPVAPVSLPAYRVCLIEQALDKSFFALVTSHLHSGIPAQSWPQSPLHDTDVLDVNCLCNHYALLPARGYKVQRSCSSAYRRKSKDIQHSYLRLTRTIQASSRCIPTSSSRLPSPMQSRLLTPSRNILANHPSLEAQRL